MIAEDKLELARKQLEKRLPIDKIRQIKKYKSISMDQYLTLLDKLALFTTLVLETNFKKV